MCIFFNILTIDTIIHKITMLLVYIRFIRKSSDLLQLEIKLEIKSENMQNLQRKIFSEILRIHHVPEKLCQKMKLLHLYQLMYLEKPVVCSILLWILFRTFFLRTI